MAQQWHDVNDPGFLSKPGPAAAPKKQEPEETEQSEERQEEGAEVKLSDGKFLPPSGGPSFNGKCRVQAKVEYLKETQRKKVSFSLFSTYDGQDQDMKSTAEGFEKDGVAEAELTLYYNDAYYDEMETKPDATVDYYFKAAHSKGQAELESERLTMPHKGRQLVLKLKLKDAARKKELDGDTYALFSTDAKKTYNKKVAIKDAREAGESTWELVFNALPADLSYSLEVELGADKIKYLLLDSVTLEGMSQAA